MYCGRGRVEMVNRSCVIIKMLWLAEVTPVRGDGEKQTAESEHDARDDPSRGARLQRRDFGGEGPTEEVPAARAAKRSARTDQ